MLRRFSVRFVRRLIFSKYLLHVENFRHFKKRNDTWAFSENMEKVCIFFSVIQQKKPDGIKSVSSEVYQDHAELKKTENCRFARNVYFL